MTLETAIFYASAAIAVLATLAVITRRNAIHALLYLIASLLAVAVMFFTLGAPLAAALEVIVYAGAIVVLIVFVVMMFNLQAERPKRGAWMSLRVWAGPAVLAAILLAEFLAVVIRGGPHGLGPGPVPPRLVGLSLFSTYLLGVELAAMLLLAAVVGAFHLGSRKPGSHHRLFKEAAE
jgi:NADH-quinone oxidoreductase subunit J